MSNRRLSERIPFRKKVNYGLSDRTLGGYTFNLTEDGIGIKAPRVFPFQSKILMQIHISGTNLEESSMDEIIRLEGIIAWVSRVLPGIIPTMGIKFLNRSNDIKRIYLQRLNWRF